MAERFGMTQDDIDATSPEHLGVIVDQLSLQLHRSLEQNQQRQQAPPPPATPAPEPEEESLGLTGDDWDERLTGVLTKIDQRKKIKELEAKLAKLEQWNQEREAMTTVERLDAHFSKYPKLFGDGKVSTMDPADPHLRRRRAVYGDTLNDHSPIPIEQKLDKAIKALYGKAASSAPAAPAQPAPTRAAPRPAAPSARDRNREAYEEWEQGYLAAPTQRAGNPEPNGVQRAVRHVTEILNSEEQLLAIDGEPASIDDFPD